MRRLNDCRVAGRIPFGWTMRAVLLLTATILIWPISSRADSIGTYDLSGLFQSGGSLSGTVTIDFTSDQVTSGNVTADGLTFTCPGSPGCALNTTYDGGTGTGFRSAGSGIPYLFLEWLTSSSDQSSMSLTAAIPSSYCDSCLANGPTIDFLESGMATGSVVMTPEPSTCLLLVTGLLAIVFLARRFRNPAISSI